MVQVQTHFSTTGCNILPYDLSTVCRKSHKILFKLQDNRINNKID